ncbi:MAG: FecR domain-containing protein [Acidovorax sp.]
MVIHRLALPLSAIAMVTAGLGCAHAQAIPDPQTDEIAHTVRAGDTLEGLAGAYLDNPRQWPLLQQRNKVANPRRLQPGSTVWIPVRLQPRASAQVEFVQGNATAQPAAQASPQPLAPGARLDEGTRLQVGPDSFVAVRLADGTVVRVQPQSDLQLRQLRRRGRTGSIQSVMEVRAGSVESSVTPSTDALRRFEVRTPRAVTSVRGTEFGVALAASGQATASVLEGTVAVQSRAENAAQPEAGATLLARGQGMSVAPDGTLGAPRPLLAPPDLSTVPAQLHDLGLLAINLLATPGASGYVAQVARDAALTQVLRSGRFADGQLRWAALEDGSYHLAVRAVDEAGIAGQPATRAITIKTRPVPPLYQQPAPGAVVPRVTGALRCTEVPGARWYRIQVAASADFASPLVDEARLNPCQLTLATLPLGNYFWRAATVAELAGGALDQGPFAPAQAFTVAQQPAALDLSAMQATDGDTIVRLHWPAQAGQRFRVQLAPDLEFTKVLQDTQLDEPRWTSAADLPAGTYFVRIQVLDPSGLQSEFSPPRSIRVGTGLNTSFGLPLSTMGGEPVRRP